MRKNSIEPAGSHSIEMPSTSTSRGRSGPIRAPATVAVPESVVSVRRSSPEYGDDWLLRGAELAAAEAWRGSQPELAPEPPAAVLDLIHSSRLAANPDAKEPA